MQNFKERLYNFEATPPAEIWKNVTADLDGQNSATNIKAPFRRRSKFLFYSLTAAASLLIIFLSSVLFNKPGGFKNEKTAPPATQANSASAQEVKDSLNLNNKTLEAIIKSSKDKNTPAKNEENGLLRVKKYITIEGPEGQPVKISPKVATLIESADNEYPPKPVWNKKIEKWKQVMLSSTFSPTFTSLFDVAQLSAAMDNNE